MPNTTSVCAEVKASEQGSKHCESTNIFQDMIEIDGVTIDKVLNGEWKVPCNIVMEVDRINYKGARGLCQIQNICRDGN